MSGFSVSSLSARAISVGFALAFLVSVADAVTRTSSRDSMFDVIASDSSSGIVIDDDGGTGMVRLFSDARVHAGDHLKGDVVAVFGSVDVEGEVDGSAVAVFGSVRLGPNARISDGAVAVGGELVAAEGSQVRGESVSVGFLPLMSLGLPAVPVVLFTVALAWLVSVFFGWVLGALFPTRMTRTAITASRRTGLSLALGLLWGLFTPVILVLLAITVVGLPLVFLVPLLGYAGYLTATYLLGCKLTGSELGQRDKALVAGAAGHLFVAAFFIVAAVLWSSPGGMRTIGVFFLFSGIALMLALSTLGTGAVLLSRLGLRPNDSMGPADPVTPQAPAAPPAAPPAAGPMPVA